MSGRYRYEPSNGWLWILPPVGPSFASVYEKSASGADSNTRAVREIVIELNRLLDRAVYAESHRLTAETALDEAIARADKASNALIRTTAALRETTDRAEKAEARVAELEREVAAWSPARHYGEEDDVYDPKPIWHTIADGTRIPRCPTHGYGFATEEWGASSPPVLLRVTCQRCSWASGPIERAAPPQSPAGASGGDPGPEGGEGGESSGPKVPDRIAWFATPEADAFRVYNEMLRHPGHPQRGLTTEEVKMFGSTDTLAFGKSVPVPSARSCEGCKGVTDSPGQSLCPTCRLWWLKQGFAEVEEPKPVDTPKRPATTCEDVKCPCVEEHGPVTLTDEDARCRCLHCEADRHDEEVERSANEALKAAMLAGRPHRVEASPATAARAKTLADLDWADPAAAAEVEARTGAYVTRLAGVVTVTAIDGVIVDVRHPRAGLPSRDEVAAFLDGLVPRNEPKAEPERPCVRCRKGLPPDRAWFHAECMNPRVNP